LVGPLEAPVDDRQQRVPLKGIRVLVGTQPRGGFVESVFQVFAGHGNLDPD
jgi:hypothetical protein